MNELEAYFQFFREFIIGNDQSFPTPYGEKNIVYADWTASGRLYQPIEFKMSHVIGPFVANTHSESNVTGGSMTQAYQLALEKIKEHVHADEYDVIISEGSGMTGVVNKLQRILGLKIHEKMRSFIQLSEEDIPVVFVTHMEHHSNHTSWVETLGEVVCVEPSSDGRVSVEHLRYLLEQYKNRKVKIGSFTACSNVTGIQTPYHELAKVMHEYGGLCFVDFSASAPYIDIDMHPKNPMEKLDAIFFSPHKFLGGPGTTGILIFDSRLYTNQVPDHPGGGTVTWTNPWGGRNYVENIELREDGGTPAFLQTMKVALCLELKNQMNVKKILQREKEQMNMLFDGLEKIEGLHILAGKIKERIGIISFYFDDIHFNLVVKILNDRFGIQVRGGCSCAGTYGHYLLNIDEGYSKSLTNEIDNGNLEVKPGWVRLSIHPVMTNEEIQYMIESIQSISTHIKEWEKDYQYNLETNEFEHIHWKEEQNMDVSRWFQF